jgi:hypothetical protein
MEHLKGCTLVTEFVTAEGDKLDAIYFKKSANNGDVRWVLVVEFKGAGETIDSGIQQLFGYMRSKSNPDRTYGHTSGMIAQGPFSKFFCYQPRKGLKSSTNPATYEIDQIEDIWRSKVPTLNPVHACDNANSVHEIMKKIVSLVPG